MSQKVVLSLLAVVAIAIAGFILIQVEDELGLGPTLGIAAGVIGAAALGYATYAAQRKRRSRAGLPEFAKSLGLGLAGGTGYALPPLPPFDLMSRGLGRSSQNVMSGDVGRGRVWLFDYTYYTENVAYSESVSVPIKNRNDYRYSCALAELTFRAPPVRISREGALSGLARSAGVSDVQIGVEAFDRAFKVEALVPDVARQLLDPGIQQLLFTFQQDVVIELSDRYVLLYARQRSLEELRALFEAVKTFRDRLPGGVLPRVEKDGVEDVRAPALVVGPSVESSPPTQVPTTQVPPTQAPPRPSRPTPQAGLPSRAKTPVIAVLLSGLLLGAAVIGGVLAAAMLDSVDDRDLGRLLMIGAVVAALLGIVVPLWARAARRRRLAREAQAAWSWSEGETPGSAGTGTTA